MADKIDVLTITSNDGSVKASIVPELGAIVSSLIMGRTNGPGELLFLHPFFWDRDTDRTRGGLPFIFPVCGRLERGGQADAYLYEGHIYRMSIHGFSTRIPWKLINDSNCENKQELILELSDTEETRAQYPFRFTIRLRFIAEPGLFVIEQEYINNGEKPMPYYAGFHPYFLTAPAGAGKEKAVLDMNAGRQMVYNERLTDLVDIKKAPTLPSSICEKALNEALIEVADKETRLKLSDGTTIHMIAEGVEDKNMFPYVQLYTVAEDPFFCVEPWMAFPNALNTVAGSRWIQPGASEEGILKIWTTV